jgi:hypothetical protein
VLRVNGSFILRLCRCTFCFQEAPTSIPANLTFGVSRRSKVINLNQKVRYWKGRALASDESLNTHKRHLHEQVSYVADCKRRKKNTVFSKVSVFGGYKMAVLRNIGHIGSDALLTTLGVGFVRQTINRWECLLQDSIICRSIAWYDERDRYIEHLRHVDWYSVDTDRDWEELGSPDFVFTWGLHAIRGDATNSAAGEHKAHVCEIRSRYCLDVSDTPSECMTSGPDGDDGCKSEDGPNVKGEFAGIKQVPQHLNHIHIIIHFSGIPIGILCNCITDSPRAS